MLEYPNMYISNVLMQNMILGSNKNQISLFNRGHFDNLNRENTKCCEVNFMLDFFSKHSNFYTNMNKFLCISNIAKLDLPSWKGSVPQNMNFCLNSFAQGFHWLLNHGISNLYMWFNTLDTQMRSHFWQWISVELEASNSKKTFDYLSMELIFLNDKTLYLNCARCHAKFSI